MNQVVDLPEVHSSPTAALNPSELAHIMAALADCLHPRAQRLQQQIQTLESADQETLRRIHADARHVLYLSFGTNEANRRLNLA